MKVKTALAVLVTAMMLMSSVSYSVRVQATSVEYKTNNAGETYGNLMQADILGVNPDLILALGENDVVGYVRTADLEMDKAQTPEEAIELQHHRIAANYSGTYIPLYGSDGVTVIGKFWISFDNKKSTVMQNEYTDSIIRASTNYAYGTAYNVTYSGYTFSVKSGIKKATGGVRGISHIKADKSVPAGYMGAMARIIRVSDKALVRCTNWYYNNSETNVFSTDAYYLTITGNSFYSQGYTREYDAAINDYRTHTTNRSPNVTS